MRFLPLAALLPFLLSAQVKIQAGQAQVSAPKAAAPKTAAPKPAAAKPAAPKPAMPKPAGPKPSAAKGPAPTALVATVNAERVTVAQLRDLLAGAPPVAVNSAKTNPNEFLEWTWLMRKFAARADREGTSKESPYAERLDWSRLQILRQAAFEEKAREYTYTDAQLRKSYEADPLPYVTMHTSLLFVAEDQPMDPASKAKMDKAAEALKAKRPFAEVVREFSDWKADGSFPAIAPESNLPRELRLRIAQTKEGAYTEPYHIPRQGYYVFQVDRFDRKPFESVKDELGKTLKEQGIAKWMDGRRNEVQVKVLNEAFFQSLTRILGGTGAPLAAAGEIKPESELATINGKVLTAKDYTNLMKAVPPGVRSNAIRQPVEFLNQYGLMLKLAEAMTAAKVDQRQPWKGRIEYDRMQILTQGFVDQYMNGLRVMPDEQKQNYDSGKDRFRWAKARLLYVSFSLTPPPQTDPSQPKILNEDEARAKIEDIAKQIRGGADFVRMVERFSEDNDSRPRGGEGPPINASDPAIPDVVKQPVLAAKPGDLVGPVKLPNGFYLLKVEESGVKSYEQVKDQIYDEIRQTRFNAWFQGEKKSFQAKIVDPAVFQGVVGAVAP